MIEEVLGEERYRNLVFFSSQWSENSLNLSHLIWHNDGPLRLKLDFIPVFLGYAPLVLHWDARLVLDWEFLFR